MPSDTALKELYAALSKMQGELENAKKNANNPHFKSEYANLQAVIGASKEALEKHGFCIFQTTEISSLDPTECILITTLAHIGGECIRSFTPVINGPKTAQGLGSAMSYARRYAWLAILGMTQEDDDASLANNKQIITKSKTPIKISPKTSDAILLKNPGDHIIQIGEKYNGTKIKDVPKAELQGFMMWCHTEASPAFKAKKETQEFLKNVEEFLMPKTNPKTKPEIPGKIEKNIFIRKASDPTPEFAP